MANIFVCNFLKNFPDGKHFPGSNATLLPRFFSLCLWVRTYCTKYQKSNNSSCGIPGKFLAIIAAQVSFQLYKVFNNIFADGIFPDVFKIGHMCCIYKGLSAGLKSSKNSWRPITLLPTLSKVAESVLHKRLLDHFIENNVISHQQAAYLKGDSTIQQVLYIVHKIRTAWSKKSIMQGVS